MTPAAFSRAGLESRAAQPAREAVAPAHFAPAPKPAEVRPPPPAPPKPSAPPAAQAEPAPILEPPAAPAGTVPPRREQAPSEALESLAAAIQSLRSASARLAEQARSDALEIAFVIARRILEAELKASPEPLFALVRSAVRRLGEARQVRVRLCPADAAVVKDALAREELPDLAVVQTEVTADPSLSPGDCLVESTLGSVDGRLDVRLAELKRAVAYATDGGTS